MRVKPGGTRRVQPVVDRFFFWLRATALETRRVAAWWADRMVATDRPLQEKMALFWHGHFATGADKVRDYRKMLVAARAVSPEGHGKLPRAFGERGARTLPCWFFSTPGRT